MMRFSFLERTLSKISKKRIVCSFIFGATILFLFFGNISYLRAQTTDPQFGLEYAEGVSRLPTQDIRVTIFRVINVLLSIVGIIFLVLVIYGGYVYMVSQGVEEEVNRAKKILRSAVIGLAIILASLAITQFILQQLSGATGLGNGVPTQPRTTEGRIIGGLGNGPIEYHYPERDQREVPRNTMIAITFKEASDPKNFVANFSHQGGGDDHILDIGDKIETFILENGSGERFVLSGHQYEWNGFGFYDGAVSLDDRPEEYLGLNSENLSIFPQGEEGADNLQGKLGDSRARVGFSEDLRTFTFFPAEYLGSPSEAMWYRVQISSQILKTDGKMAFQGITGNIGYEWNFEVSTIVDTSPPQLRSVSPRATDPPTTDAANVMVKINFSEPLNPLTASGKISFIDDALTTGLSSQISASSFRNIELTYKHPNTGEQMFVAGEFALTNGYTTIQFLPRSACGVNACGETMYCLERDPDVALDYSTLLYAAFLDPNQPQGDEGDFYAATNASGKTSGITDMAMNSFDGNNNGISEGSEGSPLRGPFAGEIKSGKPAYNVNKSGAQTDVGDDALWKFGIDYDLIISSPEITEVLPLPDEQGISQDASIETQWNRVMDSASLSSKNITLPPPPESSWQANYWIRSNDAEYSVNDVSTYSTRMFIRHDRFPDPTTEPNYNSTVFTPEIGNGVRDGYQNCYSACVGPLSKNDTVFVTVYGDTNGDGKLDEKIQSFQTQVFHEEKSAEDWYQYDGVKSAQTEFTAYKRSRVFVYRDDTTGHFFLGMLHNKADIDAENKGEMSLKITAPSYAFFEVLDDPADTISTGVLNDSLTTWYWTDSTDGGMIYLGDQPTWEVQLSPFIDATHILKGITAWDFLSADLSGENIASTISLDTYDWVNPIPKYRIVISKE